MGRCSFTQANNIDAFSPSAPSFVLGTAGHIDHGKSTLVRYLTGVDPDRLAEEKRRGITIELGFAQLVLPNGTQLGVVDVPGHERFVRHMVEGATGIDVALLVVAADDGVMVQTREHVSILELLGIRHLVVAVSKVDLTGADLAELAVLDVAELLHDTPFADAEIVPVSGSTGQGVPELLAAIERAVSGIDKKALDAAVRLPVDRVFSIEGSGTIVTGTLWEGSIQRDDMLEVNCSKLNARVRSIQVHGVEYSKARCGQRVALNLAGIKREQVSRGDIIASPGTLTESTRFNAWLHYVGIPQKDAYSAEQFRLKDGMSVHIHHATRETTGRVRLLYSEDMDKQERPKILERGTAAFVQIRLDNALPVSVNDHFIVRSISPAFTIAGGTVLECEADASPRVKLSPAKLRFLKLLRDKSYNQAIDALFELSALPYNSEQIAQSLHVPKRQVAAILNQASGLVRFKSDIESFYLSHTALNKLKDRILSKLLDYHQANPQALDISVGALQDLLWKSSSAQVFTWNDSRFEAILEQMHDAEIIVFRNGRVQHPESASAVQAAQEELAAALLHRINSQNLAVENMQELADSLG
ncbi:MAG: selenocysteine-specific translation elongation factor, partial [Coriobacteriia bacterium]|nr:selenocysteine-specific translation elongation factor [Coriobacteriia bacterium]